eukprot:scaffold2280_cov430-Prasinococcus_capsulatus_cf.AAC.14
MLASHTVQPRAPLRATGGPKPRKCGRWARADRGHHRLACSTERPKGERLTHLAREIGSMPSEDPSQAPGRSCSSAKHTQKGGCGCGGSSAAADEQGIVYPVLRSLKLLRLMSGGWLTTAWPAARRAEFGVGDSTILRHDLEQTYDTKELEGQIDAEAMNAAFTATPPEHSQERFLTLDELLAPDPDDDLAQYMV